MNEWRSQNVPAGEPIGILVDHRHVGWACGARNVIRADRFTKSSALPRTLWPSWNDVSAEGWPIEKPETIYKATVLWPWPTNLVGDPTPIRHQEDDGSMVPSSLAEIFLPVEPGGKAGLFEIEPSLRDRAKGDSGFGDDEEAFD